MHAILSLIVCLSAQPSVCETVLPDYTHADGQPVTFFECLGAGGQSIANLWLSEHPGYALQAVQCSIGNDAEILRDRISQPEA